MARSVLIVDDDPHVVDALRAELEARDVNVETAGDAPSACALLDEHRFCGLVLDVVLTDGNGFDVLRHLERTGANIPTVVITQKLPAYVREMLDEQQVKLVFPKPIEMRVLTAVILGLCGMES
ncbi:MAG TPA: response regulator [Thermoanaerobaculia bacterium]|nr:response regulator [Thermoanaerobaculia bacterium]